MERNPIQTGLSQGWQTMGRVWAVNQRAATDLMTLTEAGVRSWVELNQSYLRRVSERPGPGRVLQLNTEYVQALLGVALKDAEKRAEVMTRASREFVDALTARRSESGAAAAPDVAPEVAPDVNEAAVKVAELVAGPQASVREVQETAQEAMDDDLQQIEGVGKVMARTLREGGINTIAELALLDLSALQDEKHPLHHLAARMVAEEWVEQARALSGLPRA